MNKQQLASKIWESANKMRSKIEANEYKDYILGFIFYKFLSENELMRLKANDFTEDELEALRDDGTLQGYLLRSVYHASLNALKKGANATAYRSWVAQQIEQSCYAHYDPDDSEVIRKLYSQEIAGQIDAAVESLSPKCREVFRMSHIEGLSNREISERLGITLSTVENHIYNALKQLRQKLSHYKMLILLTMYILGR